MVNRDEPKPYLRGLHNEPISYARWEELTDPEMKDPDERRVGRTEVTLKGVVKVTLSTVWCGRLHLGTGLLPWETALFDEQGDVIDIVDRYTDKEAAEKGHAAWIAKLEEFA